MLQSVVHSRDERRGFSGGSLRNFLPFDISVVIRDTCEIPRGSVCLILEGIDDTN